ncbi:MAG: DUF4982 domain-containing protein [Prevotella sp.]|nr:DUF4982 domain-containing protein [Prevotella sp.]
MKRFLILLAVAVLMGVSATARNRQCFDSGWQFMLDNRRTWDQLKDAEGWRAVDLPHDWAIEGDFYAGNPSGAGGGALPGGIGWYRKSFDITGRELKEGRFFIEFDGVYMNSTVWLNGHELGHRPYGYSSFEYELTPYLINGTNTLVVKVDNSDQPNSRWYSGCGIYRHVWLTKTGPVCVAHWGTRVQTQYVKQRGWWCVDVYTTLDHGSDKVQIVNTLLDAEGNVVKKEKGISNGVWCTMRVYDPKLWSVESPYVYTVRTEVMKGNKVIDTYETTTGFRSFRFDPETGFWLNGKNFKLNGVCEHHDLGCFGAALNEDALHRKLTKLKTMGVNSIRCSHNPPAPELLNMCDTMGLIVMDESFDMWRRKKTQNDYARFFDEWHERDLSDLVLRDRNHPCIMMWSIGNEVLEQWSSAEADTLTLEQANLILNAGHDASTLAKEGELSVNSLLTRHLAEIVKKHDTTRPITAGCNEPSPNNHLFKSGAIDIIGFNYHHEWIKDVPKNFPGKPFIMSESVSALQTRGYYTMPSDTVRKAPEQWWLPYTDPSYMCSAYDNMHASWSSTHEETWNVVKHNAFVGGQYIWTGFDYIGEPTPYGFPARSSYFGIIDLAGFPKDVYYMYQSEWTQQPVLHLFPHWNWLPGQSIDLWCYYNQADEVELFVNGKSQGTRRKQAGPLHVGEGAASPVTQTEYHVMWRVQYEPGEVRVVARKNGKEVREQVIRTAGTPDHIRLTTDYKGKNTTFITVEVVDKDGNLCPWAEDQIYFSVSGKAEIVGTDNGCQTSMESFKAPQRKAFFGKCMVAVKGSGKLIAQSVNLTSSEITIQ